MTTGAMVEPGQIISTGSSEIDKKLGGGIPVGSLVLLEGQSDAGKSVVSQHFSHGALTTSVLYLKCIGKSGPRWPGFGQRSWSRQRAWGLRW